MPLKEKLIIERIRQAASDGGHGQAKGIGDDCAVLQLPRGHEALVTTDFSLEDVHFRRAWHPAEAVGHRCLARGLSDIAAMGGIPQAAFLSLAVPAGLLQRWIDGFIRGLLRLANRQDVTLAGGDTAQSPGADSGRHSSTRLDSGGQGSASLDCAARRFAVCYGDVRVIGRHPECIAKGKEASTGVASQTLLSGAAYRSRTIPAGEEARVGDDRHQRRPFHRSRPHLRRE